ncbi:hypothetical protein QVD17_18032 [Tagetes erecta]|uniref:DUF641 domain-containing protein n=1 Tax=Tagetes erecta TaxID=13708 RepID=A0AAD8NW02_TARER|nr:hypothetical protein QVD17_18032 [Tagetes erecta]
MASTTSPPPQSRTKLSKTIHSIITFKNQTKATNCLHLHNNKLNSSNNHFNKQLANSSMYAFVAKLFATVSSLKAAYAELQTAQFPYDGETVKRSDLEVVDELKTISDLKRCFMKKQIDSSPVHITLLLSEIKEQQSLMKMYQITIRKLEVQVKSKDLEIDSLQKLLTEANSTNDLIETKLNSSSCFPRFDGMNLSDLNLTNFVSVLNYALRSVHDFVKLLICEMRSVNWNIDAAVNAIVPDVFFPKSSYKCFAFESFVTREIFEQFVTRFDEDESDRFYNFNEFKKMKSLGAMNLLNENVRSSFAKFTRAKYMRLVHPKMEMSLFGNLRHRKTLNSWRFPVTGLFGAFAEMARRVWMLRCLALSFDEEVSVFRVRKGERFSNVYMENVVGGEISEGLLVAFTVVPGFKIGKTVVQSQVYLSSVEVDSRQKETLSLAKNVKMTRPM